MITGKVIKYTDDNINTDVIWPGKYTYSQMTDDEMKSHAMENFDLKFKEKVTKSSNFPKSSKFPKRFKNSKKVQFKKKKSKSSKLVSLNKKILTKIS